MLLFDYVKEPCEKCLGMDLHLDPCICSPDHPTVLEPYIVFFGIILTIANMISFAVWAILKLKLDLLNAFNSFRLQVNQRDKIMATKKYQNT